MGVGTQPIVRILLDTIKIHGTDIRSLDALQKETQGIKDTTQQKDEQIDQLKHRVFELQSSVIQRKWLSSVQNLILSWNQARCLSDL